MDLEFNLNHCLEQLQRAIEIRDKKHITFNITLQTIKGRYYFLHNPEFKKMDFRKQAMTYDFINDFLIIIDPEKTKYGELYEMIAREKIKVETLDQIKNLVIELDQIHLDQLLEELK